MSILLFASGMLLNGHISEWVVLEHQLCANYDGSCLSVNIPNGSFIVLWIDIIRGNLFTPSFSPLGGHFVEFEEKFKEQRIGGNNN